MYPFGYGLSYTTFNYSDVKLSATQVKKNTPVTASVTVTNSGKMDADEVVQFYVTYPQTGDSPQFSLKGFKRIALKAGESKNVEFAVTPEVLQSINDNGKTVLLSGDYHIYIGGSTPTKRSADLGMPKYAEAVLKIK